MASTYVIQVHFRAAVPGQTEGAPSRAALIAKAWWQLPGEGAKRDKSRVECPFSDVSPKPLQRVVTDLVMLSTSSFLQPGGFCFALCVKLLVWQGTDLPALCLSFPIWAERLIRACSCSGVRWKQVHPNTLKSSDEKHWRRTEAY